MPFDPDRHHRRSIRLPNYDYALPGSYFVTICTYQRLNLFEGPELRGIAETVWQTLPRFASGVLLDAWVVMPNHVHGIITITDLPGRSEPRGQPGSRQARPRGPRTSVGAGTLSALVRSYKGGVTRRANRLKQLALGPIWQRGFWERVIRDERELQAARDYIVDNPRRWAEDHENLDALLARMQME